MASHIHLKPRSLRTSPKLNKMADAMSNMETDNHGKAEGKYSISVIVWGGDKPGEDPPAHVALAVHDSVPHPEVCHLHHARCPDQIKFIYESRSTQLFAADPAPRGRCNIRTDLSAEEARYANEVLTRFGSDETQLPYFGEGNCHNWTAGAVGALENAGLTVPGDAECWSTMIGKGPVAMETYWKAATGLGREWVGCESYNRNRPEIIDAKWGEESVVGRGADEGVTLDFQDRVGRLQQLLRGA